MNTKRKGHTSRGAPLANRPPLAEAEDDLGAYDRILKAARPLFATYGFNGTSVRDITSAANVNISAVGYYFTTKGLLYTTILQSIVSPIAPSILSISRETLTPLEKIEQMVRALFAHIRANPDMPTFMVRELAEGPAPSQPIIDTMGTALPAMAGVIAAGQQDGTIRDGAPVLMALSTVAQPVYLYLARAAIAPVAGVDVDDQRIVEHAVAFVRAALEKR